MSELRHIAIYLPSLSGGGAERVMVTLSNAFASLGYRVDLVLATARGPYLSEVSNRVRIVDLRKKRVFTSLWPLMRYLRHERPDALLSALNHANVIAIIAHQAVRSRARIVVSERNSLNDLPANRKGGLFRALMRRLYPRADTIVAVSKGIAAELAGQLGLPAKKITSIPNPVDREHVMLEATFRPQHPWLTPGQPPVILAVGRLEVQKDYPTLLKAFGILRTRRPAKLVVLGEGILRPELEHEISRLGLQEHVALLGFQANPYGWMASCDVYVLSSRHEGFPNSLVQAMACGARVVSTNCPTGPDEILENGKWGKLVPVGDATAMAKAIGESLDAAPPAPSSLSLARFRKDIIVNAYLRALSPPQTVSVPIAPRTPR